jgi:hypothetical protein
MRLPWVFISVASELIAACVPLAGVCALKAPETRAEGTQAAINFD